MFTVYIYVLDTLADWELGYVTAELNSRRFFKRDVYCCCPERTHGAIRDTALLLQKPVSCFPRALWCARSAGPLPR